MSPGKRTPGFPSDFETDFNATGERTTDDANLWLYISRFKGSPFIFNPHAKLRRDETKAADKAAKQVLNGCSFM